MPNVALTDSSRINDELIAGFSSFDATAGFESVDWFESTMSFDPSVPFLDVSQDLGNHPSPHQSQERNSSASTRTNSCCADELPQPVTDNWSENTTACIAAYKMILQYNSKGLDMVEINVRLWSGFRNRDRGSRGCTVENKVLFKLLEYISS